MARRRSYSSIGIEGFLSGSPLDAQGKSWEIAGTIKDLPEDFVVREILPGGDDSTVARIALQLKLQLRSQSELQSIPSKTTSTTSKTTSTTSTTTQSAASIATDQLRVADLHPIRPIELPSVCDEQVVSGSGSRSSNGSGEKSIPSSPSPSSSSSFDKKIENALALPADALPEPSSPQETETKTKTETETETNMETIRSYLERVATTDHPAATLLEGLEKLSARSTDRIPVVGYNHNHNHNQNHNNNMNHNHNQSTSEEPSVATATTMTTTTDRTAAMDVEKDENDDSNSNNNNTNNNDNNDNNDNTVWIPPLLPSPGKSEEAGANADADADAKKDAEMRARRKAFHLAIRLEYPFLKTESATRQTVSFPASKSGSGTRNETKQQTEPFDASESANANANGNANANANANGTDHWIKVVTEDAFDALVPYLHAPRDDLRELLLFRNRGFEGARAGAGAGARASGPAEADGGESESKNENQSNSKSNSTHSNGTTLTLSSSSSSSTSTSTSSATLRLRPGLSKEDRRNVHHILASKNKHFESSIRNHQQQSCQQQGSTRRRTNTNRSFSKPGEPLDNESQTASSDSFSQDSAPTIDLVVTWKRQALNRAGSKRRKRKAPPTTTTTITHHNGNGNSDQRDGRGNPHEQQRQRQQQFQQHARGRTDLLCVMKKTNKEHLTAIQILTKKLRCRQSDIGFAGIKDMRAVTYQFLTLRNTTLQRVERAIRNHRLGPGQSDIELKILCSNADSVLNVGSLEGNRFEITVRNLKRVVGGGNIGGNGTVDGTVDGNDINNDNGNSNGNGTTRGDSFASCDAAHIDRMVERIRTHGFVNFYGEQRIGAPGTRDLVGVRAFEIGRAMLKNDFRGAINLLMEGSSSSSTLLPNKPEPEAVQRIRSAWRDSKGDPSVTLKAFRKDDVLPRERAVLRGLNRYPDNPLEALRFLSFHTRIFYINAYQSYVFNKAASERIKRFGNAVATGDLYLDDDDDYDNGDNHHQQQHYHRDDVRVVKGDEVPSIRPSQIVLPLPGHNVRYPEHEIGKLYRDLLEADGVSFEKDRVPEATAKGSYRRLVVRPRNLVATAVDGNGNGIGNGIGIGNGDSSACRSMKLCFDLPKGSYATMLLRELMMTTMVRSIESED